MKTLIAVLGLGLAFGLVELGSGASEAQAAQSFCKYRYNLCLARCAGRPKRCVRRCYDKYQGCITGKPYLGNLI